MPQCHSFFQTGGTAPPWPYSADDEKEHKIDADVPVIGEGIAGFWAAISAARKRLRVALWERGDTVTT